MKIFSIRTIASVLVAINALTAYELMAINGHVNHLEILVTRQTDIAMQNALMNSKVQGHPHTMLEFPDAKHKSPDSTDKAALN